MPVRHATPLDQQAMVAICAAAFFDESLFGPVIHPYRHEYPEDVKIFWHDWIWAEWKNPRNIILVATTTENEKEKIVGVIVWQRQGDDEVALKVEAEWVDIGPNPFPPLPSTVNRAMDPSRRTILQDTVPYFSHHWSSSTGSIPRTRGWFLDLCCVHPSYEHRGFGREMVHWGLKRAKEENVHASVLSSHENDTFYLRCGFDEVIGNCTEGEGNPLGEAGAKGGNIIFMWPKTKTTTP